MVRSTSKCIVLLLLLLDASAQCVACVCAQRAKQPSVNVLVSTGPITPKHAQASLVALRGRRVLNSERRMAIGPRLHNFFPLEICLFAFEVELWQRSVAAPTATAPQPHSSVAGLVFHLLTLTHQLAMARVCLLIAFGIFLIGLFVPVAAGPSRSAQSADWQAAPAMLEPGVLSVRTSRLFTQRR